MIRTVIIQAAARNKKQSRQTSCTRAMRTQESFGPAIAHVAGHPLVNLLGVMLAAIACHEMANGPIRLEPGARQPRPQPYKRETKPGNIA